MYLFCPNSKPQAEEEVPAKAAKKGAAAKKAAAKSAVKAVARVVVTEPCEYEKRIGDAPPPPALPTAGTHGPVKEEDAELEPVS